MSPVDLGKPLVADVKCYYCGHVSGQIVGLRGARITSANFIPRPGYTGPDPKPGARLRCERCHGPVFLEEAPPMAAAEAALAESLRSTGDHEGDPSPRAA
jgi:hypothetical protein